MRKKSILLALLFSLSIAWSVVSICLIVWRKTSIFLSGNKENFELNQSSLIRKIEVINGFMPPMPHRSPNEDIYENKYPCDNNISDVSNDKIYRNVVQHKKWKQIYVDLPPFHWETPRLLNNETAKWFWMQPENYRHFEDTINPYSGCVRVIKNGLFSGKFSGENNVTHYINVIGEPEFTDKPEYDIAFYLTSGQTKFFQHFLDNGIPHIAMMLLATGFNPKDVTMVIDGWRTKTIPDILKRWGFKQVVKSRSLSAKTLVIPEVIPVIHQTFYDIFINAMKFNYTGADKIIFVSRTRNDTKKKKRLILNQEQLFQELKKEHGDNVVLFAPTQHSFESAFSLFQKAMIVIGAHGGAMYNAMFSSPKAKIVEIMPIGSDGLYPGQNSSAAVPSFAHMAIYTNAQLMGQPFYRYYQITNGTTNMNVSISDVVDFINEVIEDDV